MNEKRIGLSLGHKELVRLVGENEDAPDELLVLFLRILENAQANAEARLTYSKLSVSQWI